MGQCYLMVIELKGNIDEKAIVQKTSEYVDSRWDEVRFPSRIAPDMPFIDAMKALFGDFTQAYRGKEGTKCEPIPNGYLSGFDGSYGWGDVVEDWFAYIAPVLGDGTEFYLEPDHGHTDAKVVNGKAIFEYHYQGL